MTPASHHLSISRGVSLHQILTCLDSDTQPVNFTGYTVISQARKRPGEPLAFDLPFTVSNATAGELTIDLTPTATAALPLGRFEWDLLLRHTESGRIYGPFVAGDCTVRNLNTQPPPPAP